MLAPVWPGAREPGSTAIDFPCSPSFVGIETGGALRVTAAGTHARSRRQQAQFLGVQRRGCVMAFFRILLQKLLRWSGSGRPPSGQFLDPKVARQQGYQQTPGGLQWAPAPRQPVEKSRWKPCHGCGRLIPVEKDYLIRPGEPGTAGQRTSDPDGTVIDQGATQMGKTVERLDTWSYVCPFCGHCHVGTPGNHPDLQAQKACHECGSDLGAAYQCPRCSFPRGWMTVACPYCGNRQPVLAPHWVVACDTFILECVKCESQFCSLCIC
jgi:hypothetical protein